MLIVLSGRPGVGKTTIARELAHATGAVHLRIDSIEQALRGLGQRVEAEGYAVGYAIAHDNLRLGRIVIADCVNPWPLTRAEWRRVAARAGVSALDVEIVCSDTVEHRRRVESRQSDIPGHRVPGWSEVMERDYLPWTGERLVIETAHSTVTASVAQVVAAMPAKYQSGHAWGERLPVLPAKRVALRSLVEADAADVFAVFSNQEVMRYWDAAPMVTPEAALAYVREIHHSFRRRELFQWGIASRADDRIIGTCTLLHLSHTHERAEIGFALAQAQWGRGLGTEAVTTLLSFVFANLQLHRVEADVDPRNTRSLRLLERLGFTQEGLLRHRYYVGRERQDAALLGLLRSAWRQPVAAE